MVVAFTMLVGSISLSSAQTSAASDLPAGDFPQCSDAVTTYCISEVTFLENGVEKPGVWVPSGSATNDANGVANTTAFTTFSSVNYPGRWSYNGFPLSRTP